MNYKDLAAELLQNIQAFHKAQHQKNIKDRLQGEALVLNYIEHCQNVVVPREISSTMGVSSARVAAILNNLEGKGLITREINRDDRRNIIVKLTDAGRNIAIESKQEFIQIITDMLTLLGEQDAKEYVRIMGRLAEEISKANFICISNERIANA